MLKIWLRFDLSDLSPAYVSASWRDIIAKYNLGLLPLFTTSVLRIHLEVWYSG